MSSGKNISASVVTGSAWLGAAGLLVNVLAFFSTLVLARLLTPEDFGLVALASTFIALAEAFTSMSVSSALIHLSNVGKAHLNTAWTLGAMRGAVLAAVIAGLAFPLSEFYDDQRLSLIMYVLATLTFVRCLFNPKYVVFEKDISYHREFVILVATKFIAVVAAAVIAYIYHTYWALIIGSVISGLVRVFLSYWFMPYLPRPSFEKLREIWSFTGWLTLGSMADAINSNIDTLMIGATLTTAQLGAYRIGDDLAKKPTKEVMTPLQRPLFPAFSLLLSDRAKLIKSYCRTQYVLFAIILPFGVGFSVIAEPVVNLVLGPKWHEAIFVIEVLAANFALQSFNGPAVSLAYATGKTKAVFTRQLIFFAIRVPVVIVALLLYGLPGLVLARFCTGLLSIALNLYMVNAIIAISPFRQLSQCWRSLLSATLMVVCVYFLRQAIGPGESVLEQSLALLSYCVAGAFVYITVHLTLWIISGREDGPEVEIISLAKKALAVLSNRWRRRSKT